MIRHVSLPVIVAPFLAVLFSSCSDRTEETPKNGDLENLKIVKVSATDTSTSVTAQTASRVAVHFKNRYYKGSRSADGVLDIKEIRNAAGTVVLYAVNHENGGFTFVSASKNMPPVIAFNQDGYFNGNFPDDSPMKLWLDDAVKSTDVIICDTVHSDWRDLAAIEVPYGSSVSRLGDDPPYPDDYAEEREHIQRIIAQAVDIWRMEQDYTVYFLEYADPSQFPIGIQNAISNLRTYPDLNGLTQLQTSFVLMKSVGSGPDYGPFIKSKWHQLYPYNQAVFERVNYKPTNPQCEVGCVPLAVARVMHYHKQPASIFDFAGMPNSITNSNSMTIPNFIYAVGNACGVDYFSGVVSVPLKNAETALINYGYSAKFEDSFSNSKVISSLSKGLPVLVSSNTSVYENGQTTIAAHAWICDGYRFSSSTKEYQLVTYTGDFEDISPTMAFTTLATDSEYITGQPFYHMSWGYPNGNDSYVALNASWTVGNTTMTNPKYTVTNIKYNL